jgi:glycogen phosphorylase
MNKPEWLSYQSEHADSAGVDRMESLVELALDIRSSWFHAADRLWRRLEPDLFERTHSGWIVLRTVSRETLRRALADPAFCKDVDDLIRTRRDAVEGPGWFQKAYPQSPLRCVAYFSMEYMLSEALPIYSGGLGNVAGDQLKAASDLGVPVIGVGLLYQQGYFRQMIDPDGGQEAQFPYNNPGQLPITPLRNADGDWLRLKLEAPREPIWLRAWQVQVGRVKLYLLDSNDAANYPPYRTITSELYGGGPYSRLMQELVLGIGGWRLLAALGIEPEVCHLNEGHAALAVLERARDFMQATGQGFEAALAATRAGNLFTTHTAVAAGFDRFSPALMQRCLGEYARTGLGLGIDDLLALGRQDPGDRAEDFNMAYLAMRGSKAVNGVSRLHGEVSRQLFAPLFPRWPTDEAPIGHVTNGVHIPTWESEEADKLWTEACGPDRWLSTTEALAENIRLVPDDVLWRFRGAARAALVDYARKASHRQSLASGATPEIVDAASHVFDSNTLTIGFARRFATYKRATLLLRDPERLVRLLTHPQRPIQIVLAGKAHPADQPGQALIRDWLHFIGRPEVRSRVIFLSDYDMSMAERLVQGVDVWLNTPRRPWEASGTSGMKGLANGVINLSELDGWWAEAYAPEVGWALGDGLEHGDDPALDAIEADALYRLLEGEVVPAFYDRDERGVPQGWVARMRESMARLTPHYSTNRVLREYVERYYLPAVAGYLERANKKGERGLEIVNWRRMLRQHWAELRFGEIKVETRGDQHVFEAQLHFGDLEPQAARVELYANGMNGGPAERREMTRIGPSAEAPGSFVFSAAVSATRPSDDYTARVMPHRDGVSVPLEESLILWQR